MAKLIVKPKIDVVFKMIFADKKNEDILKKFLCSVLKLEFDCVEKIDVSSPEMLPEDYNLKFVRLDMRIYYKNTVINVELQIGNLEFYKERVLYYWSKSYTSDLPKGIEYDELKKCVSISIVGGGTLFDDESYISTFKLMETMRKEVLTDHLEMYFLELKKLPKVPNEENELEMWLSFINAEEVEDLERLSNTNIAEINRATELLKTYNTDANLKEVARIREKAMMDERSYVKSAERRGRAEGKIEGKIELLLSLDKSDDEILEVLRKDNPTFSLKELQTFKNEILNA